jgi:hypothetical protein
VPGWSDVAVFDGTSSQNAVVDAGFAGTVGGLMVSSAYQGSLTVASNLTVTGALQNDGQLSIQNGTLTLDGGGQGAGTFNVGNGGVLQFAGGTFTAFQGAALQGGGQVVIGGGAGQQAAVTVAAGATEQAQANTTLAAGGSIGGAGTYVIGGPFNWTGAR